MAVTAGLILCSTLLAGPVLILTNGKTLKGTDLRREDDLYILTLASGGAIPVPTETVKEVKWIAEGGPGDSGSSTGSVANMVSSKSDAELRADEQHSARKEEETQAWLAQQQADQEQRQKDREAAAQQAMAAQPQAYQDPSNPGVTQLPGGVTVAGPGATAPPANQQLAVFGKPSKWPPDIGGFNLKPSYWVPDADEAMGSPSTWSPPDPGSSWVPTDGFAKDAAH